jgi:hypothetical protein
VIERIAKNKSTDFCLMLAKFRLRVERWTAADLEARLVSRAFKERDRISENSEVLAKRLAYIRKRLVIRPCASTRVCGFSIDFRLD